MPASFDVVFSEGVLHHTPSTERALKALVPLLRPGGELMIYVYRRKAPIREFTDDYVRERLADLDPAEAWEALRPLTQLGQALAELDDGDRGAGGRAAARDQGRPLRRAAARLLERREALLERRA